MRWRKGLLNGDRKEKEEKERENEGERKGKMKEKGRIRRGDKRWNRLERGQEG